MSETIPQLQVRIGSRVRAQRLELGDTVEQLAKRADLSPRFLSDVEAGKANISVSRLAKLAGALHIPLTSLLSPRTGDARQVIDGLLASCSEDELARLVGIIELALGRRTPPMVVLLGVRGAGKSTVGRRLAQARGVPFVELAERIEAHAGMPLGDIFTLHGEAYYRDLEMRCFADLVEGGLACVAALPGGIVTSEHAFTLIRASCTSVWLRGTAEDYWDRVFAQGDTRPMTGRTNAMADLRRLVDDRQPLYGQADLIVDTSGVSLDEVVAAVLAGLEAVAITPPHPSLP